MLIVLLTFGIVLTFKGYKSVRARAENEIRAEGASNGCCGRLTTENQRAGLTVVSRIPLALR
jgi:hypothetical protein